MSAEIILSLDTFGSLKKFLIFFFFYIIYSKSVLEYIKYYRI